MRYEQTIEVPHATKREIEGYLAPHISQSTMQDRNATITLTAHFPDGFEVDVKCCGVDFEEGNPESNASWTEAVLFDATGAERACSDPEDTFEGDWELECEGDTYVVHVVYPAPRVLDPYETIAVEAAIRSIAYAYRTAYWNQNQREAISDFTENSGMRIACSAFRANSYVWDEGSPGFGEPNFVYGPLAVSWYKHLGRNTYALIDDNQVLTARFLGEMVDRCTRAIKQMDLRERR